MIGGEIKTAGEKKSVYLTAYLVRSRPSLAGFFLRGHAMKKNIILTTMVMLYTLIAARPAHCEMRWVDLQGERTVVEADWLRLHLEVLALRLSYPAYRVSLEIDDVPSVKFTFVASGGMAKHLTEEVERDAAEEVLSYHARGIRDQVETLIKENFPNLWDRLDMRTDLSGSFMGPGGDWSDPPKLIGEWRQDAFSWAP